MWGLRSSLELDQVGVPHVKIKMTHLYFNLLEFLSLERHMF